MPDLDDVADELYGLPPEEFTAARDAAAAAAGDKELAKAVKALRRPTVSAWLVNGLARRQPELLEQLLALGPALAQAQADRSGEDLRTLGQQRRELVQAVTAAAVEAAGRDVAAGARTEVEQTLDAALADPSAAGAVRSGALVRALSFAGFGGVDVEGAVAVTGTRAAGRSPVGGSTGARKGGGQKSSAKARSGTGKGARAVEKAERAALDAAASLDDAVRAGETAERRYRSALTEAEHAELARSEAQQRVTELEQQLSAAREVLELAGHRAHDAQRDADAARQAAERAVRRVGQAQDAAEQTRAALDALRRG